MFLTATFLAVTSFATFCSTLSPGCDSDIRARLGAPNRTVNEKLCQNGNAAIRRTGASADDKICEGK